ncbi:MAG: hypothetical protein IAF08_04785 [Rhizobacter sp.]|nr:hypothetical protein [Chlorobiales bacterium]
MSIKKILGIVWILMGGAIIPFIVLRAIQEIGEKPTQDNWIFWSIVLIVLMPIIALSMILFGWYAWQGEYEMIT